MNRKLGPTKSPYEVKEEQLFLLLEGIEQHIEEYKKIIERKDRQLVETKKKLQGAKSSLQKLTRENKQLKEYITAIKQQQQQQQQKQPYWQTNFQGNDSNKATQNQKNIKR